MRHSYDLLVEEGHVGHHTMAIIYAKHFGKCTSQSDQQDQDESIVAAISVAFIAKDFRGDVVARQRLNWQNHVQTLQREGQFRQMYRMNLTSFNRLLSLVSDDLVVDQSKSKSRTGIDCITPELRLHCTLRYLAGGLFHDIRTATGMSISAFYSAVRAGIHAINKCTS